MATPRPLGDYLRARRELVRPEDAGITSGAGRRRVAGLRRSEVAQLAGISSEYYVKLEQGREVHPTHQVLEALSRALQLDATARSYLHSLARIPTGDPAPVILREHQRTRWLIDSWPNTAALVHDRHHDIVATNAMMRALFPAHREGSNSVVNLLLDPTMREMYGDGWDGLTERSVALMRTASGLPPYRVRTQQVVAQLNRESERFREVWPRNDVVMVTDGVHHITHPEVGELALQYALLPLTGTDGHAMFLYFAEPGSPTERSMSALGER